MTKTNAGRFYERSPRGRLREVPGQAYVPDVWICRRVVDYAPASVPTGAAFDDCSQCGARIAYNPLRRVAAPRVCMQCGGIEPLPIEPQS